MAQYILTREVCSQILLAELPPTSSYSTIFSTPMNRFVAQNPSNIDTATGLAIPSAEYENCLYINFYGGLQNSFGLRTLYAFGIATYLRDQVAPYGHFGEWSRESEAIMHGVNAFTGIHGIRQNLMNNDNYDLGFYQKGGVPILQTEKNIIKKSVDSGDKLQDPRVLAEEMTRQDVEDESPAQFVWFDLIHFNTRELKYLIEQSGDGEIYLTENLRSFSNMEYDFGGNQFTPDTKFVTLTASISPTMSANENIRGSVLYSDGRPCPPYWSPNTN